MNVSDFIGKHITYVNEAPDVRHTIEGTIIAIVPYGKADGVYWDVDTYLISINDGTPTTQSLVLPEEELLHPSERVSIH